MSSLHVDKQLDFLGNTESSVFDNDVKANAVSQAEVNLEVMNSSFGESHKSFPNLLLILDTETNGLDAQKDECLEIGAILFHVFSRTVLSQQSFLLPVNSNAAEIINKIPAEITRLQQPWQDALLYFEKMLDATDILVAHNAEFDRQWFGKKPLPQVKKPWLCTMNDISWPSQRNLKARPSVRDLALAYEVPVWNAHRALTDCIYLSEVFRRCDDLETLIRQGLEPRKLMRAQVSYEERHLAKKAGFTWNDPVPGAWSRRLSEREINLLDFPVVHFETS